MTDFGPLPWLTGQWQLLTSQVRQDRLAHAYLLAGEQGLGKRQFASQAAALLLCTSLSDGGICGACRSCQLLEVGNNPDLQWVAPEEGSKVIKIEQVRRLSQFANMTRHGSGRKVIVVEQAHCMNTASANALLKTLEEPPAGTVLILISDTPGRLLATIRSRCQRIAFTIPEAGQAEAWLNSISDQPGDLHAALELAGGKPLLAATLLESGGLETRNQVLRAFGAVLAGRLEPADLALKGRELGPALMLDYLWQTTVIALKSLLLNEQGGGQSGEIKAIMDTFINSRRSEDELLARLLAINQAADEARRQVVSESNPNVLLVLESILWRWSRLAG